MLLRRWPYRSFSLRTGKNASYDCQVTNTPNGDAPDDNIHAQIDSFLAKLREDEPAAPSPAAVAPALVEKPVAKPKRAPLAKPEKAVTPTPAPAKAIPVKKIKQAKPVVVPAPAAPPTTGRALPEWARNLEANKPSGGRVKPRVATILALGGAVVVVAASYVALAFDNITVSEGIRTSTGPGDGQSVLVMKTTSADQGDLVVGVMPGTGDDFETEYVMGTVFSSNEETYAIYDGEVVWQVPISQLTGKVLFSKPDQFPGQAE